MFCMCHSTCDNLAPGDDIIYNSENDCKYIKYIFLLKRAKWWFLVKIKFQLFSMLLLCDRNYIHKIYVWISFVMCFIRTNHKFVFFSYENSFFSMRNTMMFPPCLCNSKLMFYHLPIELNHSQNIQQNYEHKRKALKLFVLVVYTFVINEMWYNFPGDTTCIIHYMDYLRNYIFAQLVVSTNSSVFLQFQRNLLRNFCFHLHYYIDII